MAENDAEKKKIARLDFDVSDAINNLDKVANKLNQISKSSETSFKNMGKNFSKVFTGGDYSKDIKEIQTKLNKIETLSDAQQRRIKTKVIEDGLAIQKAKEKSEIKIREDAEKTANFIIKEQERQKTKAISSNKEVEKSTENLYDKITQYAKTYIIYQGFNALKKAISETIDEMVDMEYQMVAIDRVLNESSLDIDHYRDKLVQLAYDYGNSFNNVADITLRLAQAGFDSNEAIALTEKTLLALNTAELNATQATDDMVAVMAQWGLMTGTASEQAKSYGDIIDKINKVADNFPTTSSDIMDALKKVSSAFNLAGADIDETIATIVAAEKASQRGGKVIGTALANIVQQLKAEGKLNLAEQLGLDFFEDDAKTKFKPIMEIFQEMSDRMATLKEQGKESSIEMQQLLEMFTVFRRNIGASLLGEMEGGEESTYMQVYKTALDSVGYSLQENEKYLKTAKAAQAQFNAELLKLKTSVWDNGLENVFRDMLSMGINLVNGIESLIDKFGAIPTTLGLAITAFTAFNKKIQAFTIDAETGKIKLNGFFKSIADGTKAVRETNNAFKTMKDGQIALTAVQGKSAQAFIKNTGETIKYGASLVTATVKTVALQVATIALNAAISMGLSLAITAIISAIDNWIHKEERMTETLKENMQAAQDNANKIKTERETLQSLAEECDKTISKYKELKEAKSDTTDTETQLYKLQEQLNTALEGTGKQVSIINTTLNEQGEKVNAVNEKYEEQLSLVKSIAYEKKKEEVEELRKAMEDARKLNKPATSSDFYGFTGGVFDSSITKAFEKAGIDEPHKNAFGVADYGIAPSVLGDFYNKEVSEQISLLNQWINKLKMTKDTGEDVSKTITTLEGVLKKLKEQQTEAITATDKYNDAIRELYALMGNIDNFNTFLNAIAEDYNIEGPRKLINDLKTINKEFSDGKINVEEYFNKIEEKIKTIDLSAEGKELEAYQAIFAATTASLAEGVESLIQGYSTGQINFAEYASGIKEAGDDSLELFTKQNGLIKEGNELWSGGTEEINNYANVMQRVQDNLGSFSELLTTIGDNYDYIAEHANSAGEAMFVAADVGTKEYAKLANSVAQSLGSMQESNKNAYNAIVSKVYEATGKVATEEEYANDYITEALNEDANALNAALNESANQLSNATERTTVAMGTVFYKLGQIISKFSYNIKATPYINGGFELHTNDQGIPDGLKLPSFGFDITGSGDNNIQDLSTALNEFGLGLIDIGKSKFSYTKLKPTLKSYSSPNSSGGGISSGSTSGGSGGSSTETSSATTEEDDYKKRLAAFKAYITEKERLEQRWVNKQKELGQLTTKDFLYITQERIERYKQYLKAVEDATWIHEEDKLALQKEYSEKIEDLQLDYLGYLKTQLEEDIAALKKNNSERIDLIKAEATERINALKKVEKENDRIRQKEEYEENRRKHLEDVSYWEQRTGRQAQEALKEAKEKLEELDKEWQQQMEDWSIEDQIKAIEEQRDAQIKAIEDAQQAEIDALQAAYDAKVKLFSETGQIIYEGSVIQSKALYNQYKENFIDPIKSDLAELNKVTTSTAPAQAQQQQEYETYLIRSGDTLSKIAAKYGTTVDKIMAANPYVTNKNRIYTGKTLQIPKFHEGGIFGGPEEGYALLKKRRSNIKT